MTLSNSHILIVDDDDKIRDLLKDFLLDNNFLISTAANAEEALDKLKFLSFDLIIVDIMMPGMNGYELTKKIRESTLVPLIHLTAMGKTENVIHGLEIGADDYIGKPFEPRELLLRVNNILNKTSTKPNKVQIQLDTLILNLKSGKIKGRSKSLSLNGNEIKILKILSSKPGESFSREHLVKNLGFTQERTLDVCVNRLRKKIEKNPKIPRFLKTKRGSGYVLWID